MSDAVKKDNWFIAGWKLFWLNVWAFITTEGKTVKDWNLDPLKVIAIVLFVVLIYIALEAVGFVKEGKSEVIVGYIVGLVTALGGYASFLLSQAKSNDSDIRHRDKEE